MHDHTETEHGSGRPGNPADTQAVHRIYHSLMDLHRTCCRSRTAKKGRLDACPGAVTVQSARHPGPDLKGPAPVRRRVREHPPALWIHFRVGIGVCSTLPAFDPRQASHLRPGGIESGAGEARQRLFPYLLIPHKAGNSMQAGNNASGSARCWPAEASSRPALFMPAERACGTHGTGGMLLSLRHGKAG